MGVATLGFDNGPSVKFRIDPSDIQWQFQIDTAEIQTLGGRVVQVVGATLGDLIIQGSFGENHKLKGETGQSWRLADAFAARIRQMMEFQSKDNNKTGVITKSPAIFSYPPRDWKFRVNVVSIEDPDGGGSVQHRTGKFSYDYVLTLFIVEDLSPSTAGVGSSRGVIPVKASDAIDAYLNRISDGIGWKQTEFNGPLGLKDLSSANDVVNGVARGVGDGAANSVGSGVGSGSNPGNTKKAAKG